MSDQIIEQLQDLLNGLLNGAVQFLPRVVLSLLVVVVALFFDNRAQRAVERVVERHGGRRELGLLLGRVARWSVLILAGIIVLSIFDLNRVVSTFLAGLGLTSLVIAFALQDITKNFAAGALLSIQNPFGIGDRIKVRDFEGVVVDITMRTTALRTADGVEVLVPNADVYASSIINYTHFPHRRHHILLTLPASVPAAAARDRLLAVLHTTPGPEPEPAPYITLTGATNDAVTLDVTYWLPSASQESDEVTTRLLARLHGVIDELKREAKEAEAAQAAEVPAALPDRP